MASHGTGEPRDSGRAGAAPPVDAPLRVDLQDGGVISVVVLHLRVGKLGTVDVDDNGGAARALPRGRQTPDLPGIPPGGAQGDSQEKLELTSQLG